MSDLLLSPIEARVIGALVEKSVTTPQYYPMTVNAIMMACNQKNCRNPVMALTEGDTGAALNRLESLGFASRDDHSGRVPKWRHRFQHQMLMSPQVMAVLITLMLRGPQTLAELRANAATLGGPSEPDGLDAAMQDLSDRRQPLIAQLPRAPGQKEMRYTHLVCGTPEAATEEYAKPPASAHGEVRPSASATAALEARVLALETRLAELERQLGI